MLVLDKKEGDVFHCEADKCDFNHGGGTAGININAVSVNRCGEHVWHIPSVPAAIASC